MKKTNERGYTFEVDESLTKYARESINKVDYIEYGLPSNIIVLKITKREELIGYILFDTKAQQPLSKELGVEEVACRIDAMKFIESCKR